MREILSRLIEYLRKTKNERKNDERERVVGWGEKTGIGFVRREKFRCFPLKNSLPPGPIGYKKWKLKRDELEDRERVIFFFGVIVSFPAFLFGVRRGRGAVGAMKNIVPPKAGREFSAAFCN